MIPALRYVFASTALEAVRTNLAVLDLDTSVVTDALLTEPVVARLEHPPLAEGLIVLVEGKLS